MRVLLLGAGGFIGRHVAARLAREGVEVVAGVRDPAPIGRRFPGMASVRVDLNRMTRATDWAPLLAGIDAVVNAAGILQSTRRDRADAVHDAAPRALFDACLAAGVRRVVQVSAVSADPAVGTEYARSKAAADAHLAGLDLDWIVLRPSIVYGAGSYGGTSALRGLAGLPWVMPLLGDGGQRVAPIHVADVAETVWRCLSGAIAPRQVLDAVGPEVMTLRDMLVATRAWLDLPPARLVPVPMGLVRMMARVGDLVGAGPIRSTSVAQLEHGNVADPARFAAAAGFVPRRLADALRDAPSHVQDRWHARLYFVRPMLTVALALLWIGSGLAGLFNPPADAMVIAERLGLGRFAPAGFSLADLGIAALVIADWRWAGVLQIALVAGYTLGLSLAAPGLWFDPYGALLKNLPILAAIAAWSAMREAR